MIEAAPEAQCVLKAVVPSAVEAEALFAIEAGVPFVTEALCGGVAARCGGGVEAEARMAVPGARVEEAQCKTMFSGC